MDSKDFQLIVALDDNARQSYESLGRRVSLSAPAVRDRLKRLQIKGVLQGFNLMINPNVFGRFGLVLFYHGNFQRKATLAALAAPDVSWVRLKLDGQLIVGLWTKDKDKSVDHLANILGTKPSEQIFNPSKECSPVSITDLTIMDALVDNPTVPFGELLKSTWLSPKTVRKHLNHLLETKTISIAPALGTLADSGELIYPLVITGRVNMSEIRRVMGEVALLRNIQDPPMKYVLCMENSLADMITKTRALENVEGVRSVEISLNKEVLASKDLRHSLIREEIRKLEKDRTF